MSTERGDETKPIRRWEPPPPPKGRGLIFGFAIASSLLIETMAWTGEKEFWARVALSLIGIFLPLAFVGAYYAFKK